MFEDTDQWVEQEIEKIYPAWVDKLIAAIILLVIVLAVMEIAVYIALGG